MEQPLGSKTLHAETETGLQPGCGREERFWLQGFRGFETPSVVWSLGFTDFETPS